MSINGAYYWKLQTKIIKRYHLTPVKMEIYLAHGKYQGWWGVVKKVSSCTGNENVRFNTVGTQCGQFFKKVK